MKIELDRIDIQLIRLLRKHARLSNKDLAEAVGVAPSTALERVRRLRETGVIQGFHAEFDPQALGIDLQAMVAVRLARHSRELLDGFREHLLQLPEVLAFYHVAGANDFQVQKAQVGDVLAAAWDEKDLVLYDLTVHQWVLREGIRAQACILDKHRAIVYTADKVLEYDAMTHRWNEKNR